MESETKTLAFLLCMHRSGSSLTASIFQELGMSLGPFPLLGADSSNIHGHYESLPLFLLNRKVQEFALGFPDDVPKSADGGTFGLSSSLAPLAARDRHESVHSSERGLLVLPG